MGISSYRESPGLHSLWSLRVLPVLPNCPQVARMFVQGLVRQFLFNKGFVQQKRSNKFVQQNWAGLRDGLGPGSPQTGPFFSEKRLQMRSFLERDILILVFPTADGDLFRVDLQDSLLNKVCSGFFC